MTRTSDNQLRNLECRDPVHGFVYLSEAEWAIVDCLTFQRLRDIRQLAMAHLVYPGATHTRFEHSLGCLHLSDVIFKAVKRQVEQGNCPDFANAFRASEKQIERGQQILRLAGLLHDLGHSPFSHSGEKLMPEIENDGTRKRVQHEDMTERLIRDTEIAEKVRSCFEKGKDDEDPVEEVIAVATGPERAKLRRSDLSWYRFLNDILAGELGSDRMDYLLRDAMHSGQSAGRFDYHKLIDSMTIVPPPEQTGEAHRLGLDGAGWLVGEQMVVARYLMYVALYFHKTKRIYEIHLEDFLKHWLQEKYGEPHLPSEIDKYTQLTDSVVWAAIYEAAQGPEGELRRLARPFVDRSHLRLAHELLLADNFVPSASLAEVNQILNATRKGLESVKDGADPDYVMEALQKELGSILLGRHPRVWNKERFDKLADAVYSHVRNVLGSECRRDETTHSAAKFFGADSPIWVYMDGKTRYLDDLSEIVRGMPSRIWRGRIYVDVAVRKEAKSFCDTWLSENPSTGGNDDAPDASADR
jgi:HD superfamily phosphohydrolase